MPSYITPKHLTCGILIIFLVVLIAVGCTPSKQPYENLEAGISLEKPSNWELAYSERNGIISLASTKGVWKKDSIQIQIHGSACLREGQKFSSPNEEIERNIQRIKTLYSLDSITIVQEPMTDKNGSSNEVTKAAIQIPAAVFEEAHGEKYGSDAFQIINIFQIKNGDESSVMVYVFQSNNDALNVQAEKIIDSIQFNCPSAP